MRRMRRASTHALARVLLRRPEAPIRSLTVGRFTIMWDGKPGDYRETVSTEELFGFTTSTAPDPGTAQP